jgi:hypothetical protein
MGFSILSRAFGVTLALSTLLIAGCAMDPRYSEDEWKLPKKGDAESAMIIGRIALPENKKENPDGRYLWLYSVVFVKEGGGYICGGTMPCGEKAYTMYNSYFVVPNLKPGVKYYFRGFATGDVFNTLPIEPDKPIVLKPGQILFIGSHDYLDGKNNGAKLFFGMAGSYSLRPTDNRANWKRCSGCMAEVVAAAGSHPSAIE